MNHEQLIDRYRKAVECLVPIAKKDTSGSRAAAQVLLSTYNGSQFHLNPIDLGLLDPTKFKAAIDVLQLRHITSTEPHSVIDNGDEVFSKLWAQWDHLRICNRYNKEG